MKRRQFTAATALGVAFASGPFLAETARAETPSTLEGVKQRGVLRAGVRQDVLARTREFGETGTTCR